MRLGTWPLLLCALACGGEVEGPPPCGSGRYAFANLIPGPGEAGHDAALAEKARRHDRLFVHLSAAATGLNADLGIPAGDLAGRARVEAILADAGLDEQPPTGEVQGSVEPSAGLYSGAGLAADAFRYGTLRDQGASCGEIAQARAQLLRALEGLHLASTIPGVPGVIARGVARRDLPGFGQSVMTTPLFDAQGAPLPAEKDNGTWRADNSGRYPGWVWQDSASRDMLVGWAMAFGAAREVLEGDDSVDGALLSRLAEDARAIGRSLSTVQASGYDLEIRDADGRMTFHGVMNEHGFERLYLPELENGFYALMGFGIVAALARAADDPALATYLREELAERRRLPAIARKDTLEVNLGPVSNHSNFNMAFTAAWLALRYAPTPGAADEIRLAIRDELYAPAGGVNTPVEMGQSLFDLVQAAAFPDPGALERGLATLREYPAAPYWDEGRINCDEGEIAAGACTLDDGTRVQLRGFVGRGDKLVAVEPIPMRVRPPSNYHWRSNPYEPNGEGGGTRLLPAVDFRVAYWLGRWVRRP